MKLQILSTSVLCSALSLIARARASMVTLEFDGIVYTGWGPIPNNASMHGRITYDASVLPTTTDSAGRSGTFHFTEANPPSLSLTFDTPGGSYTFASDLFSPQPYIRVFHDWTFNPYSNGYQSDLEINAYVSEANWPLDGEGRRPAAGSYGTITLNLTGTHAVGEPGMLSSYEFLPTSLEHVTSGYGWVYTDTTKSYGFSYNPRIDSFENTTATPEPGAALLLGGGMCLVALSARRFRQRGL